MLDAAYIFPGQGAQYVGMGEDFYRNSKPAKGIFEAANKKLGFDLSALIFKGPPEELTRTVNCQVAIFTVSVAVLRAVQAERLPINLRYTAGLSLGEYSALVAAGALNFEQGLGLVQKRAEYMQQAGEQNPGGMLCLIGLSLDAAEEICSQTGAEVANLNCPGQIVISGTLAALEKARELAGRSGAKKVISLNVGGAFHSSLMAEAAQRLSKALEEAEILAPKVPVISNVGAVEENTPEEIKDNLARQVASRTRWADSINFISSCGISRFIEIGPGRVLKGLLRKINPELKVDNIGTISDLERLREELKR